MKVCPVDSCVCIDDECAYGNYCWRADAAPIPVCATCGKLVIDDVTAPNVCTCPYDYYENDGDNYNEL